MVMLTDVFTARTSSEVWMRIDECRLTVEGTRPAEASKTLVLTGLYVKAGLSGQPPG
jgi:hypothetical protein